MSNANSVSIMKVPVPTLKAARFHVFAISFLFSIIVLAVSSAVIQGGYAGFSDASSYGLGVATAVLQMLLSMFLLGMEAYYPPTWASWTAVELSWQFLMIAFWAATGGLASNDTNAICGFGGCFKYFQPSGHLCNGFTAAICSQLQVISAFSWMIFIMLIGIFIWTLTVAIIASKRGDKYIWRFPAQLYGNHDTSLDPPKIAMPSDTSLTKAQEGDIFQNTPQGTRICQSTLGLAKLQNTPHPKG
ncbi:hypothetical protein CALCODRAFT_483376 [Calocera cornea HHB12733]|uniref:MARVEL domain-containing protein n=1 Tax=Calocera cornea HHB12733 TaxID=1353952 RepID=A0A165FSW5_9BASI|nr:hypothetical protein CALCODRAFT_483376 [Calocera cornea HHB12733]